MVIDLHDLGLRDSDLVDLKFSLGAAAVGVQHAQLHLLLALRPNVEIAEHPHLPQQNRAHSPRPLAAALSHPPQVDDRTHRLALYVDLLDEQAAAVAVGQVEGLLVKRQKEIVFGMAERPREDQMLPVLSVPELNEGVGAQGDVLVAEGVVEDGGVVDELFGELRPVELAVVLVNRDLLRLHHVQVLALHGRAQHLGHRVAAETREIELPLSVLHTPTELIIYLTSLSHPMHIQLIIGHISMKLREGITFCSPCRCFAS